MLKNFHANVPKGDQSGNALSFISLLKSTVNYAYQLSKAQSFGLEIMVLPWATSLVSNGDNIVACNFLLFAVNDIKG